MSDRNFDSSSSVQLRLFIKTVHSFYITPFLCIMGNTDLKDGHATPKFWDFVNYIKLS